MMMMMILMNLLIKIKMIVNEKEIKINQRQWSKETAEKCLYNCLLINESITKALKRLKPLKLNRRQRNRQKNLKNKLEINQKEELVKKRQFEVITEAANYLLTEYNIFDIYNYKKEDFEHQIHHIKKIKL